MMHHLPSGLEVWGLHLKNFDFQSTRLLFRSIRCSHEERRPFLLADANIRGDRVVVGRGYDDPLGVVAMESTIH